MALIQQAMAQEQAKDTLKLSFGEALLQMQTGNQLIQAANQEIKEREYERKAAMAIRINTSLDKDNCSTSAKHTGNKRNSQIGFDGCLVFRCY